MRHLQNRKRTATLVGYTETPRGLWKIWDKSNWKQTSNVYQVFRLDTKRSEHKWFPYTSHYIQNDSHFTECVEQVLNPPRSTWCYKQWRCQRSHVSHETSHYRRKIVRLSSWQWFQETQGAGLSLSPSILPLEATHLLDFCMRLLCSGACSPSRDFVLGGTILCNPSVFTRGQRSTHVSSQTLTSPLRIMCTYMITLASLWWDSYTDRMQGLTLWVYMLDYLTGEVQMCHDGLMMSCSVWLVDSMSVWMDEESIGGA